MEGVRERAINSLLKGLAEGLVDPNYDSRVSAYKPQYDAIDKFFEAWEKFEPQLREGDKLEVYIDTFHSSGGEIFFKIKLVPSSGKKVDVYSNLEDTEDSILFDKLYEWED